MNLRSPTIRFAIGLFLFGCLYIGQAWSPSSWGYVAGVFGFKENGIVLGKFRSERGDEATVLTPLIQAQVNNDFKRYNETSFYKEDMRAVYSLPVFDWGMVFKPTMWGFLFLPPAYAYSLHHFSIIALFLLGFCFLFRTMGFSEGYCVAFSVLFFCTGYVQYWWTVASYPLAYFPWILLLATSHLNLLFVALGTCWLTTCYFLSYFYPPIAIQFVAFGFLFLFCFARQRLFSWKIVPAALGTLAGLGLSFLYLRDPLALIAAYPYPGQESFGGGGVPWGRFFAHFLPTGLIWHHTPVTGDNICEDSVVSSSLLLLTLCFTDLNSLINQTWQRHRSAMIAIAGLMLFVFLWMYVPVPEWVGWPLFWHKVRPPRMIFLFGLLSMFVSFYFLYSGRMILSWKRFFIYAISLLFGLYQMKTNLFVTRGFELWLDWAILVFVFGLLFFQTIGKQFNPKHYFLGFSILIAAWSFAGFNPIQSAHIIFDRETYPIPQKAMLDRLVKEQGGDRLVIPGYDAATLNGMGYPSVSHALMAHPLDFWRNRYPQLSEQEILRLFGRWVIIYVRDIPAPETKDSITILPIRDFLKKE